MLAKRLNYRSLFTVLLILALLSACSPSGQATEVAATPYPTPARNMFVVQRGDVAILDNLYGRVSPQVSESVTFQMDGKVATVYVKVGDRVKAGDLLADLVELKSLEVDLSEARAQYESEQMAAHNTIRRAEIDLEIAQLTLELYRSQNRSEYEISIQELEVELAQMALDEIKAATTIQSETGQRVKELETAIERTRVYAPVAGQIIAAVNQGREIRTTTEAFLIGDANKLEIRAEASEEQLKQLSEGMEVVVNPDERSDLRLTGKIRQLPFPYGTGDSEDSSVRVILDQQPGPDTYKNGDKMTIRIVLASKSNVLWLSPDAIRQAGGRTFVIIDSEAGPKRIDIEVGLQSLTRVEVISGLEEGQEVVGP